MPLNLCLCPQAPHLRLRTRVAAIVHFRERHRTSNTGRLIPLALENSCLCLRGQGRQPTDTREMIPPGYQGLVLYPAPESRELSRELASQYKSPLCLILLDGNWNQASRMYKREPALKELPLAKLPLGPPSAFRLRLQSRPERVCTFEAAARALGIVEGVQVQQKLEGFFRMMVDRMLWARGRIKAEEVYGGLPDVSIESQRLGVESS